MVQMLIPTQKNLPELPAENEIRDVIKSRLSTIKRRLVMNRNERVFIEWAKSNDWMSGIVNEVGL